MTEMNQTSENCPDRSIQIYFYVVTTLSCSLNTLLFALVRMEKSDGLRPLRFVFSVSCVVDLVSALLQFSTQARPTILGERHLLTMSFDGPFVALVEKWELFRGGNLNYFVLLEYFGCYMVLLYGTLPCFFRYLMICRNYTLSNRQYSGLLLGIAVICLWESGAITFLSVGSHEENWAAVPAPNPACTRFTPQFARDNIRTTLQAVIFYSWSISVNTFNYSFLLIIFFMARIVIHLKRQAQLIESDNLQMQLTWTIATQAAIPVVAVYLPFIVSYFFVNIFKRDAQGFVFRVLFTCYTIGPLINPLIGLLFIRRFRRLLLSAVFQLLSKLPGLGKFSNKIDVDNAFFRVRKEPQSLTQHTQMP